jgi:hypothetical protein
MGDSLSPSLYQCLVSKMERVKELSSADHFEKYMKEDIT